MMPSAQALMLHGYASEQGKESARPAQSSKGIVGLNLQITPDLSPIIMEVYPGTPAQKVGLHPGDIIISVNSQAMQGLSINEVDDAISDVPGDVVHFLINRDGHIFATNLTVVSLQSIQALRVRSLYTDIFKD